MTCKGIRPDGTQCTCPDEFTDPETGLCGSCGAPESTALVPVGSTGLMADPAVEALHRELPPKAQELLRAYIKTRTIDGGAEAAGVHRTSHYYWLKHTPGYREVFEVAKLDVRDQWRRIYANRTEKGLTERTYDADGNLKQTRIREDAGLLKAQMMAVDDEFGPDRGKDSNVNIVVVQSREGW